MKHLPQTPIPPTAETHDGLSEALRRLVFEALSEVPGEECYILEIFPDVARSLLENGKRDTPSDGGFTRKHLSESGRVFGSSDAELRRVLQRCIDEDRPLRMKVVVADYTRTRSPGSTGLHTQAEVEVN